MSQIQSYLFFEGRCQEAMDFYRDAIGAVPGRSMLYKDSPDPAMGQNPAMADKIMHAEFTIGDTTLMASDGNCSGKPNFEGFGLSLPAQDAADAERLFNAVSAGGQVVMPLARTFFSDSFGMAKDRFGILWMVLVPMPRG